MTWLTSTTNFTGFVVVVTDNATGRTASGALNGSGRSVTVGGLTVGHSYTVVVTGSYLGGSTSKSTTFTAS